jgi:hypothetical protein
MEKRRKNLCSMEMQCYTEAYPFGKGRNPPNIEPYLDPLVVRLFFN